MERSVAVQEPQQLAVAKPLSIVEIQQRKHLITECVREAMIVNQHYGAIPGTGGKKALLKSGAEMLGMMFRLAPHFDVLTKELEQTGHREYHVTCTLTAPDGTQAATGLGSCSTMETKYRYRYVKGGRRGQREENRDIADTYNTVLKMAVKRAHVAAILMATGASDMFAQEEEAPEDLGNDEAPANGAAPASAPAELTPKQALAKECGALTSKLGLDLEGVRGVLEDGGCYSKFERWGDLSEGELTKCREVLAAEVEMRAEK